MNFKRFAIAVLLCTGSCSVVQKQETVLTEQPAKKPTFFVTIPITKFSPIQSPCVNVEIEGKILSVELDLGFRGDITVMQESLELISSKMFIGEKPMYGIRGKEYIKKLYRLPKIKMGAMTFFKPILQEEKTEFIQDSSFVQGEREPSAREVGRLGWELFYNTNLFVDIKNARIAFCDSWDTLKNEGYMMENFIKTALFLEQGLVEFEAETPEGPLRCTLDTAASWNVLNTELKDGESVDEVIWKPENILDYSSFKIESEDFGPIAFHRMPIQLPIRVEAILGMEFFKDHAIFLDFAGKSAYFSKE